jgi:hypothetical protein
VRSRPDLRRGSGPTAKVHLVSALGPAHPGAIDQEDWQMTYVLIAIVALYYVLLVRSHVRPYLLLRVKGDHMKYLPIAALLVMLPLTNA